MCTVWIISLLLLQLSMMGINGELQAPRFITQPSASGSLVAEGQTKILQCQALGYPHPRYQWLKDGVPLDGFSTERFYRIQSTRRTDAGQYQCVANNTVGAIFSEKVHISVAYMTGFLPGGIHNVSVRVGDAAVLSLPQVDSNPAPSVNWQASDNSLLYGIKYAVSEKHQLVILSVDRGDTKSYRARVTNTQLGKEESSDYIHVSVFGDEPDQVDPTIIIRPTNKEIVKGTSITDLECVANAKPLYNLETIWLKDGIPLEVSGINFQMKDLWNRTLTLISAELSHAGEYMCKVHLRGSLAETISASAVITVLDVPEILTKPALETLAEFGKKVTLPCQATGVPPPTFKWYRNAVQINESDPRFTIEEDGSLEISVLELTDTGMVQCIATNKAGEASAYTWLKVKTTAPVMISPPINQTVLDGSDATITCRAGGAPHPNTTWYFNDESEVSQSGRFQILASGDLIVAAVRPSDAGKYLCVRQNEAGSVEGEAFLSVLVRTQIIQPPADTKVILGHVATLQCKVSSDPDVPFAVIWYHESRLVVAEDSHRISILDDGTLRIAEARAADVGTYTCMVLSSGGNDTRSAKLDVIELPYPPLNVHAERIVSMPKSVNLSWTPGFNGNSEILKYIIQKRIVPSAGPLPDPALNWFTALTNVSSNSRFMILTNLKAAASFQFRVSAINSVGEGNPSEPSNVVSLPQEPPSAPPLGLAGAARSSSEIMIQWQPPPEEHQNGLILGYVIRYRLYGYKESPWSYRNITNEAQRNYLIGDLITWKNYEIQIAAFNDKGVGYYGESINVKTREGIPAAPPTDVTAQSVNSTVVSVSWKPPDPQKINGINQGYKLQAWLGPPNTSDVEVKTMTVAPDLFDPLTRQSAEITGLRKFTEYNITVLCYTSPGDGAVSSPVIVKTMEDVPDEVEALKFLDITDRAVTVKWSPPKNTNGILLSYTLEYQEQGTSEVQSKNMSVETLSVRVKDLKASTHYLFFIYGWTSVGPGHAKSATIQSGVEPVLPQAPSRLAVSNIEAFSVVLQFTPGFDGNSSITTWTVQAQTARNLTWATIFEVSDPEATSIHVRNLTPFSEYRLRVVASNVVGQSEPSSPTKKFQTLQAQPSHPPFNVTIRAMSATEIRVRWTPLQQIEWYGIPRGYKILYRLLGVESRLDMISIDDPTSNAFILTDLEEFSLYEVVVQAYNDVGRSAPSPVVMDRTREAAPSAGPASVEANATSSTTVVVNWSPVKKIHQNGIIEGYKVYYGALNVPFQYKNIHPNTTFSTTLTQLKKFVQYHIQVLAYTRTGDGALSTPPVMVRTFMDVPGPPSNVSFPDVTSTTARVIWDVPAEPNGEILEYRLTYQRNNRLGPNISENFPPQARTYSATGLEPDLVYKFTVTARTAVGWGSTAEALVYTTHNREAPQPPSAPQVSHSQVQSRQITFRWTPGRDGYAPLRYYTIQYREGNLQWQYVPERIDPALNSYTVHSLKPFTTYQFRIQATNDIGPSGWSEPSLQVTTLSSAPSGSVSNLKVIPITTTSVRVVWEPLKTAAWNGDRESGGYRIEYQQTTDFPAVLPNSPQEKIFDVNASQIILTDLVRDKNYEVVVVPFNGQGDGTPTPPVTVYVGEAVPTGEPRSVEAEPVTPTEVRLRWLPPLENQQNGDLLGYKIFYHISEEDKETEDEIEVVLATITAHSLVFLEKYTTYTVQILAFNPAGEGPKSPPVTVKTRQDIPGPPINLIFSDITMNSLKVSWNVPEKPNGEIIGYLVTYETAEPDEDYSKQVKQKVSESHLLVQSLEEQITYTFSVRAQTIDYGPAISGNVTTGPQDGSPRSVKDLVMTWTMSSVTLEWVNGLSGKGPVLGYYLESKKKDDDKWQTVAKTTKGQINQYVIPSTTYSFRVMAYNKYGISYPTYTKEALLTPSQLYLEYGYLQVQPFYRQTWFLVTIAAISVVITIMVVAFLCVKSKADKYRKGINKSVTEQDLTGDNDSINEVYEMRSSKSNSYRPNNTLTNRSLRSKLPKSAPMPNPNKVNYDDEVVTGGYDSNPDDSSLSEKPSQISSVESSDAESCSQVSDSPTFVDHYSRTHTYNRAAGASFQDNLRHAERLNSRLPHLNPRSNNIDSETDDRVSLANGNMNSYIVTNKARSRNPVSSFV